MVKERNGRVRPSFKYNGDYSLRLAGKLLRELDDEFCERAAMHAERGDLGSYLKLDFSEVGLELGLDPLVAKKRYLAYQLLRKSTAWSVDKTTLSAVALEKFWLAEEQCRLTNERIIGGLGSYKLFSGYTCESIIYMARKKISKLLGAFSSDECSSLMDFGPGATYFLKRSRSDIRHKISGPLETTVTNLPTVMLEVLKRPLWHKGSLQLREAPGCKVTTVPKDARSDRTIAVEPSMNMFVQKGIGRMLRRRLRRTGVDLDDQSINQRAAREGSITGKLATLDLSMASDTVSFEVVKALLPPDWFDALEQARSAVCVLPSGAHHRFHKFSTMGNGYTFELESLIFWAICSSCAALLSMSRGPLCVYGDDLVVQTEVVPLVSYVLQVFGFSLNTEKSFTKGAFRESCGKHYLSGEDITPFQFKEPVSDVRRLFWFCNQLRAWSLRDGNLHSYLVWNVYEFARGLIPRAFRSFYTPAHMGDIGLTESWDVVCPKLSLAPVGPFKRKSGQKLDSNGWLCGWRCKGITEISRPTKTGCEGQYLAWYHRREGSPSFVVRSISRHLSLAGVGETSFDEPCEILEVVLPRTVQFRVQNFEVSCWASDRFWIGRF